MPLRSTLNALATDFTASVLQAIRGASLDDLLSDSSGEVRRGPGRPKKTSAPQSNDEPARAGRSRRLKRRSPEDIAKGLDQVVALLKKNSGGLRAEQIRVALKMEAKEMPRVLKQGLSAKTLKAKGLKRATTYTAA